MSKTQEIIDEIIKLPVSPEHYAKIKELLDYPDEAVVTLIDMLEGDDEACWWACTLLGYLNDTRAVEPLIKVLATRNSRIQEPALRTLAYSGDKRAVKPFLEVIRKGGPEAEQAANSLPKLPDDGTRLEGLLALLYDPTCRGRESAVVAIANLQDKAAVEPLLQILPQVEPPLQKAIIFALADLNDPRSIEALLNILKNPPFEILAMTVTALAHVGEKRAFEPIFNILVKTDWEQVKVEDDDPRGAIIYVLGRLGDKTVVPFVLEALKDNEDYLPDVVNILSRIHFSGEPQIFETLVTFLNNPQISIRKCVVELLGVIGDERAILYLHELYKVEDNADVRELIVNSMERLENLENI